MLISDIARTHQLIRGNEVMGHSSALCFVGFLLNPGHVCLHHIHHKTHDIGETPEKWAWLELSLKVKAGEADLFYSGN